MPFGNMVDVITIKGKFLRAALEHAVEHYDPIDSSGAFLQVSGKKALFGVKFFQLFFISDFVLNIYQIMQLDTIYEWDPNNEY